MSFLESGLTEKVTRKCADKKLQPGCTIKDNVKTCVCEESLCNAAAQYGFSLAFGTTVALAVMKFA